MALGIVCRGMNSRKLWYGFRLTLQSVQLRTTSVRIACAYFSEDTETTVCAGFQISTNHIYIYIQRLQFQVEVRTANICQNPE